MEKIKKLIRCWSCKEKKPITAFHKDRTRSNGACSRCKVCHKKREQHKSYLRKYAREYQKYHPKKTNARSLVRKAIKLGVLVRGVCTFCPNTKTEAHHENYNKPLDVIWLCDLHHQHLHRGIIKL